MSIFDKYGDDGRVRIYAAFDGKEVMFDVTLDVLFSHIEGEILKSEKVYQSFKERYDRERNSKLEEAIKKVYKDLNSLSEAEFKKELEKHRYGDIGEILIYTKALGCYPDKPSGD
jgi:phosphoglycolate phosphatase-like HAD superfamily hydrolase